MQQVGARMSVLNKRNQKMFAICKALETVQPAKYQNVSKAYGLICDRHMHVYLMRGVGYGLIHKDANLLYTLAENWQERIDLSKALSEVYIQPQPRFKRVASVWDLDNA